MRLAHIRFPRTTTELGNIGIMYHPCDTAYVAPTVDVPPSAKEAQIQRDHLVCDLEGCLKSMTIEQTTAINRHGRRFVLWRQSGERKSNNRHQPETNGSKRSGIRPDVRFTMIQCFTAATGKFQPHYVTENSSCRILRLAGICLRLTSASMSKEGGWDLS